MKRILAASALVLSLGTATGAFAYTDASAQLVSQVATILSVNGYGKVDVESLSDGQISQIYLTGTGSDHQSRVYNDIRGILESGPVIFFEGQIHPADVSMTTSNNRSITSASQLTPVVQSTLDRFGYNVSATDLSPVQRAGIYLVATSDDGSNAVDKVRAILN